MFRIRRFNVHQDVDCRRADVHGHHRGHRHAVPAVVRGRRGVGRTADRTRAAVSIGVLGSRRRPDPVLRPVRAGCSPPSPASSTTSSPAGSAGSRSRSSRSHPPDRHPPGWPRARRLPVRRRAAVRSDRAPDLDPCARAFDRRGRARRGWPHAPPHDASSRRCSPACSCCLPGPAGDAARRPQRDPGRGRDDRRDCDERARRPHGRRHASPSTRLGTGAGRAGRPRGTTLAADLDLQSGKTRATFAVPALLGLAGEVVVADAAVSQVHADRPEVPVDPAERRVPAAAQGPDRSACPDRPPADEGRRRARARAGRATRSPCTLDAEDLGALTGGAALPSTLPIPLPIPDLAGAGVDLTLQIDQATTRLSGATAALDLGDTGDLTIEGTFTKLERARPDRRTARRPGRDRRLSRA